MRSLRAGVLRISSFINTTNKVHRTAVSRTIFAFLYPLKVSAGLFLHFYVC